MVPIYDNSRIEIWCGRYINDYQNRRTEADKNARIVQIEHGDGDDYIVEVLDEEAEI